MKKKKRTLLTREFMEKHGEKKSQMKLSWNDYIIHLDKEKQKKVKKEVEEQK